MKNDRPDQITPFGRKIRQLRAERGLTQKQMAEGLGVSPAYLCALEKGHRGAPSWDFVQRVIGYFNIIWDEAEELQHLILVSHPKVVIDTSRLSEKATETANLLSARIADLDEDALDRIKQEILTASVK